MTSETCPTCGHRHPGGVGTLLCICDDCGLLWTTTPHDMLCDEARTRLNALHAAVSDD